MIGSRTGQGTNGWWAASAATGGTVFARRDWATTALGPLTGWPSVLRTAVSLVLASPVPMALWWDPEANLIHNDAHARIFGDVQGAPSAQAWPDLWATWAPVIEQVRAGGTAAWLEQEHLVAALSPVFDAYDPRPIFGGKVVIQAKRYRNTVDVSAVRDLFGTLQNEGASKGILVTTSGYGPTSYEFASGKPIELIDGANLLYLLAEHAQLKARIDPTELD